jgi:predicted transcriptional regulator
MTKKQLEKFFEERKAINRSQFCREAGISRGLLDQIFSGDKQLTQKTIDKILPCMRIYGYDK